MEAVIEELRALRGDVQRLTETMALIARVGAPIASVMSGETITHYPLGGGAAVEIKGSPNERAIESGPDAIIPLRREGPAGALQ